MHKSSAIKLIPITPSKSLIASALPNPESSHCLYLAWYMTTLDNLENTFFATLISCCLPDCSFSNFSGFYFSARLLHPKITQSSKAFSFSLPSLFPQVILHDTHSLKNLASAHLPQNKLRFFPSSILPLRKSDKLIPILTTLMFLEVCAQFLYTE